MSLETSPLNGVQKEKPPLTTLSVLGRDRVGRWVSNMFDQMPEPDLRAAAQEIKRALNLRNPIEEIVGAAVDFRKMLAGAAAHEVSIDPRENDRE